MNLVGLAAKDPLNLSQKYDFTQRLTLISLRCLKGDCLLSCSWTIRSQLFSYSVTTASSPQQQCFKHHSPAFISKKREGSRDECTRSSGKGGTERRRARESDGARGDALKTPSTKQPEADGGSERQRAVCQRGQDGIVGGNQPGSLRLPFSPGSPPNSPPMTAQIGDTSTLFKLNRAERGHESHVHRPLMRNSKRFVPK